MAQDKKTLQAFINDLADKILKQGYWTDRLFTNSSVTLRKRFRDLNDNDRCSAFSQTSGNWITSLDTQNIYSFNIVQPTIRTNTSVMQNANVKIDIKPRFIKDTKSQSATEVAMAILEQKNRLQWTDRLEEFIAQEQQLGPGVFVRTRHNPHLERKHSVPQWESEEMEIPGNAVCGQCGQETPVSGEVEEMMECGSCGGMAVVETMPTTASVDVPSGYNEFTTGDTETQAIPFFEIRIDDESTQGGNIDRAKWMEHHYLASLDELQLEYPESRDEIAGASIDWGYSIRWQQVLRRNRIVPTDITSDSVVEQREVRDIFLTPTMYLNHPISEDFALKDKDGKVRFAVKKDQTLDKGKFEGETFKEPPTLCFRLVGTSLIDVFPCDFKNEFSYITFLNNSSSFWGSFLYSLVALQDIINYVLTLQFYHIRRNAITSIIYNRNSFDPESFNEDLIPTKDTIPPDIPINSQFGIIPALQMSGEPMQMFEVLQGMKSDVSLTTPAMMGQAQPNEPYHAQLLQKQSSLGLLAPAEISKATAKVRWAKQQLRCAQKYWTDEDTEELLKLNPEWTEDTIQAFRECKFDSDLMISYVEGSEIPQSLIEREIKLQNLLQQLMALGQVAPEFIRPELLTEVLSEITKATGMDIDIGNNESNLRLAESRYDHLVGLLQGTPHTEDLQMIQLVAQQITQLPIFSPLPYESFDIIIEFYSDKARNEASREMPNYLIIGCLNALIKLEQQGKVALQQEQSQMAMAAQAPMMQAQQQMMQQQQQGEMQKEMQLKQMEAQHQAQNPQMHIQAANDEAQRQHEKETQLRDLEDSQAERDNRILQARLQNKKADQARK